MTEETELSADEATREMLLMGLRLMEGVAADRFLARTGRTLQSAIDADAFQQAAESGLCHLARRAADRDPRRERRRLGCAAAVPRCS